MYRVHNTTPPSYKFVRCRCFRLSGSSQTNQPEKNKNKHTTTKPQLSVDRSPHTMHKHLSVLDLVSLTHFSRDPYILCSQYCTQLNRIPRFCDCDVHFQFWFLSKAIAGVVVLEELNQKNEVSQICLRLHRIEI